MSAVGAGRVSGRSRVHQMTPSKAGEAGVLVMAALGSNPRQRGEILAVWPTYTDL